MGPETILVVGGTEMLGEPVVRRLRADGFAVRVLGRDTERGARALGVCVGDVEGEGGDAVVVAAALAGCDSVHATASRPRRSGR